MEKAPEYKKPPVDIEQWLDFILASASHRSHEEGQQKFGELLLHEYFVELRKEYEEDPVARQFLDNMLCATASAVRAFSVARDMFQTKWDSIQKAKEQERSRAEQLENFSPFKKDGYWKQAFAVVASLGLLTIILSTLQTEVGQLTWMVVLFFTIGIIALLFLMELFVDWLRNRRITQCEKRFPTDLVEEWRTNTLNSYRAICLQFLLQAIKIREEFYPHLTTVKGKRLYDLYVIPHIDCGCEKGDAEMPDDVKKYLADVVEQHFAFKSKPKASVQKITERTLHQETDHSLRESPDNGLSRGKDL